MPAPLPQSPLPFKKTCLCTILPPIFNFSDSPLQGRYLKVPSPFKKKGGRRGSLITHPNLCTLLHILLAVAPTTGPLGRSYSQLPKLCYIDCNHLKDENIESLHILSALKEPFKIDFEGVCSFLEKK